MKKLFFTLLSIFSIISIGRSQALSNASSNNAEVRSKGVIDKSDAELQKFAANKEVFKPQTLNRIITTNLKRDGLLSANDAQLHFKLTESSLTVNNKLMPETVKEKYLSLYLGFTRQTPCAGCAVKYGFNDTVSALLAEGN